MGEYLQQYYIIIDYLYDNKIEFAAKSLQLLLNKINQEMIETNNKKEKELAKNAIIKLLPVLDDLKKGLISDKVIEILKLDHSKLPNQKKEGDIKLDEIIHEEEAQVDNSVENDQIQDDIINDELIDEEQYMNPLDRKPLSPKTLDDYIGQEKAKKSIKISINAAKKENRVLDHLLICSPYGLGKTTLANIIANEMNLPFFSVNAVNLKDTKSLSLYFSKVKKSCIIFIDEIHSLKNDVQTVLLSILTDFHVSFIDDKGVENNFNLPPFTLIGATTQAGELLKPFLNRFAILELVDYTTEEKEIIVKSKFNKLGYEVTGEVLSAVAVRSRGIPRTIETFVKGIRDIAINYETNNIDMNIVNEYFLMVEIDDLGLGKNDLAILNALKEANHPLALITLESKTGIQKEDLAYRYEPYLLKLGFIEKTERGRIITEKGLKYIK